MPDRTSSPALTSVFDSSWEFDLAAPASSLRLGATLASAPAERSVVIALDACYGLEKVPAIAGLIWSQKISAQFSYFPSPDRTVWFSPDITFAQPIDHIRVVALHWPSTEPFAREEVRRLFIRVSEMSRSDNDPALSSLYLAQRRMSDDH